MIVEDFSVQGEQRLNELKELVNNQLSNASFRRLSVLNESTHEYDVSIRYDLSDAIFIEKLHNKWKKENKTEEQASSKLSEFQKLFSFLRFSSS